MRLLPFPILIILFVTASVALLAQPAETVSKGKAVGVHFSKNVELVGYVIHLAEPEPNDPDHPITQIMNSSPEDGEQPSLYKIFELAAALPYSLIIDLMYRLPEFPLEEDYVPSDELLQTLGMETEEEKGTIRLAVQYINQFAQASNFEQVWMALEPHRTATIDYLQGNLPPAALITALEGFYQQEYHAYDVVPSLMIWSGPGWGLKIGAEGAEVPTFVLGPLAKNYDYTNQDLFLNLAIHEFGHSYVNHIVLEEVAEQIEKTAHLYPPLQEAMMQQGYQNWETCVIEHFVRAGEVLVPESMGDDTASTALLTDYTEQRQFTYLPFMVEKLRAYRMEQKMSYREAVRQTMIDLSDTFGQ